MAQTTSHRLALASVALIILTLTILGLVPLPKSHATRHESAQPASKPMAVVAVAGPVTETKARWVAESKLIVTDVTLRVEQASRPDLPGAITFVVPGGELPERNMRMTINAIPVFRPGQSVAVTLDPPEHGSTRRALYRYRTHLPVGAKNL